MRKNFIFYFLLGASSISYSLAQSADEYKTIYNDLAVFADPLATQLKKGVKASAIRRIQNDEIKHVAQELSKQAYDTEYRVAQYQPSLSPKKLGEDLHIGDGYSRYENMTGVFLPLGKNTVLVDNIPADVEVKLLIPNWDRRPPEGISPTKDPKG